MSSSCSSTGSSPDAGNVVSARNGPQAQPAGTLETSQGPLSVIPGEIVGEWIRFNPDSVLMLRVVSRAFQRVCDEFLHLNGAEIARRCSSGGSSHERYVHSNCIRLSQSNSFGVRFHVSVTTALRSMGVSPEECPFRILLSEEMDRFRDQVQTVHDAHLERIWSRVRQTMSGAFLYANAPAQEIRQWMHSEANQPQMRSMTALPLGCLQLGFVPVELELWTGLQSLDLRENCLSALPEGLFQRLGGLQSLDLGNNRLCSLPAGLFNGLTGLQGIDLTNNLLTTLPADLFHGLVGLRSLDLGNNRLRSLPAGLFNGLTELQSLFLWGNHLDQLPPGLFQGLRSLTSISLRDNRLVTLPSDLFHGLALKQLQLQNNQLHSLPPGLFAGMTGLHFLYLENNRLDSLPRGFFYGLTGLLQLTLASNQLCRLPPGLFDWLERTFLTLHNNPGLLFFYHPLRTGPVQGVSIAGDMRQFYDYACRSPLAEVYQLAAGGCGGFPETVRNRFLELDDTIKNAIYERVWIGAGSLQTDDPQWGEHHAFDDRQIFNCALKSYVRDRFQRLTPDQRNGVERHLAPWLFGGDGRRDVSLGSFGLSERFVTRHILTLIDAILMSI